MAHNGIGRAYVSFKFLDGLRQWGAAHVRQLLREVRQQAEQVTVGRGRCYGASVLRPRCMLGETEAKVLPSQSLSIDLKT